MKRKLDLKGKDVAPSMKEALNGKTEIEMDNITTIAAKPFNDLVIGLRFRLTDKNTWMSAMKELEEELYHIYANKNLVEIFLCMILDQMDEVMGDKKLYELGRKHAAKLLTKAIDQTIHMTSGEFELQVGTSKF